MLIPLRDMKTEERMPHAIAEGVEPVPTGRALLRGAISRLVKSPTLLARQIELLLIESSVTLATANGCSRECGGAVTAVLAGCENRWLAGICAQQ